MKYYNLVVHDGVPPARLGPYAGSEEQLSAARSVTEELDVEGGDSIFGIDVSDTGEPEVWTYSRDDLGLD